MRFSAANKTNYQNMPRINPSDPDSGQLRKSILAPAGHLLVIADSSQVEDRMNCYVSGQQDILDAYAQGEDAYKLQAARIYFNSKLEDITKAQRFLGKVARLGLGYGCGRLKFAHIVRAGLMGPPVDISDNEASSIVRSYRKSNSNIVGFWDVCTDFIRYMNAGEVQEYKAPGTNKVLFTSGKNFLMMPNGLKLHYSKLSISPHNEDATYIGRSEARIKIYGALLSENIIQCLARIAVISQIMHVAEAHPDLHLALLVHDEGVFIASRKTASKILEELILSMQTAPDWCSTLPFGAEGMVSRYYAKP